MRLRPTGTESRRCAEFRRRVSGVMDEFGQPGMMERRTLNLPNIGILGAGRLGTAIASSWGKVAGHRAVLWSRRYEEANKSLEAANSQADFSVAPIEIVMQQSA